MKKFIFMLLMLTFGTKISAPPVVSASKLVRDFLQHYGVPLCVALGSASFGAGTFSLIHHAVKMPWAKTTHPWHPNLVQTNDTENYVEFTEKKIRRTNCYGEQVIEYAGNRALIFVPGLGDQPNVVAPMNHYEQLFPTTHFYVVKLEDTQLDHRVLATSFGQESDIIPVLKTLKELLVDLDARYASCTLFGESRGGATVINVLAILNQEDHPILKKVDIDESCRNQIIEKLRKGGILLRVPLLNMWTTAKHTLSHVGKFLYLLLSAPLTGFRHNVYGMQPIKTVQQWTNLNIPTLVVFPEYDEVLGSEPNDQFISDLKTANGAGYCGVVIANNSSHLKTADEECDQIVRKFLFDGTLPE